MNKTLTGNYHFSGGQIKHFIQATSLHMKLGKLSLKEYEIFHDHVFKLHGREQGINILKKVNSLALFFFS